MPAIADIILFRTTGNTDPPLLHAGELAVTAAPTNVGKMWIGDGIANRLLLSANPTDLPLATSGYLPLSGAQAMTGPLTLSGPATANNHPVTLQQADGRYLQLATANTLTGAGSIVMPGGYEPTADLQVATKGYADKARVVISDTAPAGPRVADLWFNSLDLQTYIRYTANDWVPVINLGAGGGADPDNKFLLLTGGSLSGSLAVAGALTVATNASSDLQVVPLQQVNAIIDARDAPIDGPIYGRGGSPQAWVPVMPMTGIVTIPGPIGINRTPPADCLTGQIVVNNNVVFPSTGGITWNWYAPTTYLANGVACRISFSDHRIMMAYATAGTAGATITDADQTIPFQMRLNTGVLTITGNYIGQDFIGRNAGFTGTGSFGGAVTLPAAAPTLATHAASKGYVDGLLADVATNSLLIRPAAGNSVLMLDSLVNTESSITVRRNGLARWSMQFYGAETGGNTGCDFSLSRHADNGWLNTTPVLHASRETGMVTIAGDLEVGDIYSDGGAFPEYIWATRGIVWVDWTLLQDTTNVFTIYVGQDRDPYNILPTDIMRIIEVNKLTGLLTIGSYLIAGHVTVFTLDTGTGDLTIGGAITMPAAYSPTTDAQVATKGYADQLRNTSITFTYPGKPADAAMINVPLTFPITIPANFAGTRVYCTLNPTAPAPFLVDRVVGSTVTNIGTITINTVGNTFVGVSAQITLVAGDVLRVSAPGTQDPTAADIGITIAVTRA